jgi:gluconolactonase
VLAAGSGPGPGGAELLYTWTNYELLDSLAVEAGGNICVATLNRSAITVVSPEGELVEVVDVAPGDDPICTNICFGGDELRTAYITTSGWGRLYQTEWARPGLALNTTAA